MSACLCELPCAAHVRAQRVGNSVGTRRILGLRGVGSEAVDGVSVDDSIDHDTADGESFRALPANVVRECAMCGVWKPQSEFHNSRTGQWSYCRNCRRAYDRRYYHERGRCGRLARQRARAATARAWMASLKEGIPCADCAQFFPVWVMHWDHLPGREKVACISELVRSGPRTLVLEELKKCELVCANCHVMRTVSRAGCSSVW